MKRESTLYPRERDTATERRRKEMEIRPERKHLKVAIREVFDAARRRLQDHARRKRAAIKTHEPTPQARATKLFPLGGYGYLETPDGREIYFHANSVLNERFKDLKLGSKVSFTEERGEKGGSTVHFITRARATPALPPTRKRSSNRKVAVEKVGLRPPLQGKANNSSISKFRISGFTIQGVSDFEF